jgi:hypothetical protein
LGRFWQIDPLAEQYVYNSPYALQENKFGCGVELEGKELGGFPYSDPRQALYDGLSKIADAFVSFVDNFSANTSSAFEKTFGNGTTVTNTTTTSTSTNLKANLSYIKANNTNEGNIAPVVKTTTKNETSVATSKSVDAGIVKGTLKTSVSNNGTTAVEASGEAKIRKAVSVGVSATSNSEGETTGTVTAKVGTANNSLGVFGTVINSVSNLSTGIGVSYEATERKSNTKVTQSASIQYNNPKK